MYNISQLFKRKKSTKQNKNVNKTAKIERLTIKHLNEGISCRVIFSVSTLPKVLRNLEIKVILTSTMKNAVAAHRSV